jgi:hypothetical protein
MGKNNPLLTAAENKFHSLPHKSKMKYIKPCSQQQIFLDSLVTESSVAITGSFFLFIIFYIFRYENGMRILTCDNPARVRNLSCQTKTSDGKPDGISPMIK